MFWRFGGYANISPIDTLLEKSDVTLEELLDESDLIQELKQHNTKLIEYLREEAILQRLLEYVTAPSLPPPAAPRTEDQEDGAKEMETSVAENEEVDEDREKRRNRYAYVASEILSSDNWSICETVMEARSMLTSFWDFIRPPPPLDPLQASYFTKVNESLFDRKTDEMLDFLKSIDGVVKSLLQHVDSPMIMDLLLKIISLEKADGGQGIVDWLYSQDMMPILLSFLSPEHSWATQTSAGDFLKAIITISANASQNEQSCIGPNELTRQLVSHDCVEQLISDMLKGGNPLTVGVGIVIEVIRKNNSDYDPDVSSEGSVPTSRDPIYLGTLLRLFAQHIPDFMDLILRSTHTVGSGDGPVTMRRKELKAAHGSSIEPLGFDRFKTCELMAELLHCSNMGLLNEIGSEEFIQSRNAERDRLRSIGTLGVSSDMANTTDEDLTMRTSTNTYPASAELSRKLEVQNASDDDFEEVTHSADLGDDSKDELIEKPDMDEQGNPTKPDTPLSFVEKDDVDDFVDEPLSSPRLRPFQTHLDDPEMQVMPLSPTKELSSKVGALDINKDVHLPPPPSMETITADPESSQTVSIASELEPAGISSEDPSGSDNPPNSLGAAALETLVPPTANDDEPAPLSVSKSTLPENGAPNDVPKAPESTTTDITDTDAGEVTASVLDDKFDEQSGKASPQAIDPVVGDYLKMQFVDHKVVPTILNFFFRFPWNNFLHNVVYDVVQQVFNGPMDRGYNRSLAIDLFDTGDITMRIVDGQNKSDQSQEKQSMRLGYMGHLTLIAEEVVKFTERHPPELLSESVLEKVMNGDWITYVEVTLAGTRERDNAILGGARPDMHGGPRPGMGNSITSNGVFSGASSALADAGLNGGVGLDSIDLGNGADASGNAFTLSSGLISGFGSSSDEEDEDMEEETEDDINKQSSTGPELSRYISHPSTTTATADSELDLEPPSVPPPPPPPLNIAPSRARRQLAARLALHKQSAAGGGNDGKESDNERRHNLNPFSSMDEDDDDDRDDFTVGDVEAMDEGRGLLPPGSEGVGANVPLNDLLDLEDEQDDISGQGGATQFGLSDSSDEEIRSSDDEGESYAVGSSGQQASAVTAHKHRTAPRRPSVTEAKRRTSLDDDDEDGVVHIDHAVGSQLSPLSPPILGYGKPGASPSARIVDENDEMVEIGHTEPSTHQPVSEK